MCTGRAPCTWSICHYKGHASPGLGEWGSAPGWCQELAALPGWGADPRMGDGVGWVPGQGLACPLPHTCASQNTLRHQFFQSLTPTYLHERKKETTAPRVVTQKQPKKTGKEITREKQLSLLCLCEKLNGNLNVVLN